MPYIPLLTGIDGALLQSEYRDLPSRISLIEEKWEFYPERLYFPLLLSQTDFPNGGTRPFNDISGEEGTTKLDRLYLEPVAPTMTEWTQAQHSDEHTAELAEMFQYGNAQLVRMCIEDQADDKTLKRWGFDKMRDFIITIPLSLLDKVEITSQVGDKVQYGEEQLRVEAVALEGKWYNTNIRFFAVLNCKRIRAGG